MAEGHVYYFNIFERQTKVSMKKKRKNYHLRNEDDGDTPQQLGSPPSREEHDQLMPRNDLMKKYKVIKTEEKLL